MANNHAHDFGNEGIVSTEQALDSVKIGYAGISGRAETYVVTRGGVRFGFCAFGHNGYTLKTWDTVTVARILDTLRPKVDVVIVAFHGGAEGAAYSHLPDSMEVFLKEKRGYLREFAHFCIRHGADVVYGHGPHVVRCIELYQDCFIAYSLGNFCTPFGIPQGCLRPGATHHRAHHRRRAVHRRANPLVHPVLRRRAASRP